MENSIKSQFAFPQDISLQASPLIEAWLEIHWQLKSGSPGDYERLIDPGYPFALGVIYEKIKDLFAYKEELPTNKIPADMTPRMVRYRFRKEEGEWPLVQLGPGIATINFTKPYAWNEFKNKALYLRQNLEDAYNQPDFKLEKLILRYRNAFEFDFKENDLLEFLSTNLNLSLRTSNHIPGIISTNSWPSDINLRMSYDLQGSAGRGSLQFTTARRTKFDEISEKNEPVPIVLLELEIQSLEDSAAEINTMEGFEQWITSAHAIIHEWFFALIEGPLHNHFKE